MTPAEPPAHAIVMAAGEGRRLRPLSARWAKPLLPVDGRPVLGTLLRELAAAGIERTTIVTGHLADQVEAFVDDGPAWGLELAFARQPRPDGSADAVRRALEGGARLPTLVTAADTVYSTGDVVRFLEAVAASGAAGGLAYRRGHEPTPARPGVRVDNGQVRVVYDLNRSNPLTSAPLWALGEPLVPYLDDLPGPPYELKDAYQPAIDAGLAIVGVEIGKTRDLTDPLDLVEENFPYLSTTTT
jgi:CTP:molybdopterin cytidylyltransferase MocA